MIYTLFDLMEDLLAFMEMNKNHTILKVDYDRLVLYIYRRHHKSISLRTIMDKLWKLSKERYIKIVQRKTCENGVCTSDKAVVYIYYSILKANLFEQTKTIISYVRG